MHEALSDFQHHRKLSVMVHIFNPGTREMEAGGSGFRAIFGYKGLEPSKGYVKPHLKKFLK